MDGTASHVTSDEPIVPFRRLNSFEERNLRTRIEVAALVNGEHRLFVGRGKIFSDQKDRLDVDIFFRSYS